MLKKISELHDLAKSSKKKKLVLAVANDDHALEAAVKASEANIIEPILVGSKDKIKSIADKNSLNISKMEIIHEEDTNKCAEIAVKLVHDKQAEILMKGNIGTSALLKAVLNKEFGLRKGSLLSHLAIFEIGTYHKLIGLSDAGINIAPDLNAKVGIIENSVYYLRKIGIEKPKIAILAAVETMNMDMVATIDAAILSKMCDRKQIKNCIIDGPLAMDNIVSLESARHKGIESVVAGDADMIIAPDIEAANAIYKTYSFVANAKCAAIIIGASAPVVLTSRSDSDETKLNSIALAAAIK